MACTIPPISAGCSTTRWRSTRNSRRETGQGCGIFQPGSLYLAQTEAREHQLRLQEAKARRYAMNFHEVSRDEAERLHPLVDFDGVRCIMYEPEGGNVDPSGVTMAYAAGARQLGAEIHRFTPVIGTEPQADGGWIVRTPKGDVRTHLGRQRGRAVGAARSPPWPASSCR